MNESSSQPSCVLVHGAHHGPWVWDRVVDALEIPAVVVALPGRGASREALSAVTLEDCVNTVVEAVTATPHQRPVLVGHSMSGVVIARAAQRLGSKLSAVVALAAAVPDSGSAQLDRLAPMIVAPFARLGLAIRPGGRFAPMTMSRGRACRRLCNDLDPATAQYLISRLQQETAHLLLDVSPELSCEAVGRRICVVAMADKCLSRRSQRRSAIAFEATEVVEFAAGHELMLSEPDRLARMLTAVARGDSGSSALDKPSQAVPHDERRDAL